MPVVITGNPGVGKHTVARMLSDRLGLALVDINCVAKDSGLAGSGDVDTARLKKILAGAIPEKSVIVGHLAPYVLDSAESVIILRKNPYDLIPVYKERGYPDEKCAENAASEILGVVAHDAMRQFGESARQIDATGMSAGEVADAAMGCISGDDGDEVDWLGMVAENNDLSRFFAD
ncbi:MAG: shikimate kinase [Nitrosopumilus sp. H8]|nr:MAG: shikimate kinase [Nitrosopumilus sp. H8]RNJ77805.1 MAG: shikimate kinase [Nitrosopumilus sp. H13]